MADNPQYMVIGPLAVLTDKAGKLHYLYNGALVAIDITDEERDRHVARGLIAKVDDEGRVIAQGEPVLASQLDPRGFVDRQSNATTTEPASGGDVEASPTTEQVRDALGEPALERPALVASKEVWVDYAVSRGMSRARAESLSKREIMDAYPPEAG